ncbi:MAG: hypothetical protein J6W81_06945 [Lentisphaeria bacterium]|nr:hypothetical protein [Lentisphaeria bacterium]
MKQIFAAAFLSFCLLTGAAQPEEKRCETYYSHDIAVQRFYPESGANGFYGPGQKIPMILKLKNRTSRQINGRISCSIRNFSGKIILVLPAENFTIVPDGITEQTIIIQPPAEKGYFTVDAKVDADGKTVLETQSAFAVVEPITGKRDPFFTIDYNKLTDKLTNGFKAIGIGRICLGSLGGNELLFYSNYYKKSGNMREAVAKALREGLWKSFLDSDFELCAKVGYENWWPRYYRRSRQGLPLMNDEIVMLCSQYAEDLARQTMGRISLFKCNSEIDAHVRCLDMKIFGSGVEILANSIILVRTIYKGLKRGNPEAKVAVLGIFGGDYFNHLDKPFPISRMFLNGLGANFDLLCIDAYNGNYNGKTGPLPLPESGLRDYLLATADLSVSYKRPRIILNAERGYMQGYNDAFDSELSRKIALYFARSIIINRSTPSPMFTIHYCADNPLQPWRRKNRLDNSKRTNDMGIWKNLPDYENNKEFYVPRPAALTIAVAARELAFVKPVKEIIRNGMVYCYIFEKKDGTPMAAIYSIGEETDFAFVSSVPMTLTDAMGNKNTLTAGNKTLRLSGAPFYLTGDLPTADFVKMIEDGRLANQAVVSGEGRIVKQNTIRLYLRNNENKTKQVKILLNGSSPATVMLPAGQIRNIDLPWKQQKAVSKAVLNLKNGKEIVIPVNTEFIKVPYFAKKPVLDGSGGWLTNRPTGQLKTPDDIWPKSEIIPEAGNFKLDGTDIYADYWLGYDRENLYFAVKVKDKIHLQRQTEENLWMEDMVQFVLTARDLPPKSIRGKTILTPFGKDEYCYALALSPKGEELQCWSGGERGKRDFTHSVKRTGDITFYEVAIPWRELKIIPKKGAGIRFSFIVQDNNRITSKTGRYHLALTGGIYGSENQDSSLFKTLILE